MPSVYIWNFSSKFGVNNQAISSVITYFHKVKCTLSLLQIFWFSCRLFEKVFNDQMVDPNTFAEISPTLFLYSL